METTSKEALFDELYVRSRALASGVDNYGEVVDEKFAGMFQIPLLELQEVLTRCEQFATKWDGEFRTSDCEIEGFKPEVGQVAGTPPKGARVKHIPTGIVRESYSKMSFDENREVAIRALESAVKKRAALG